MNKHTLVLTAAAAGALLVVNTSDAFAHGRAGDRFFPATMAVEDPAVADELTLPQVHVFKESHHGEHAAWVTEYETEFSKRLTDKLGLSIETAYIDQSDDAGGGSGFGNLAIGAKYQLLTDAESETIVSLGLEWEIGHTGSAEVGAEDISTFAPHIFFGKGFGDLPDSLDMLKPVAVTGSVGYAIPSRDHSYVEGEREEHDEVLEYGFTLQYSLPYLQQHVKDVGLGAPFNNIVPVVEFAFSTPLGDGGTTGTINPGFIWAGHGVQVGVEAVLPINDETGDGVGAMARMHFNLDDLFPASMGKPLLGN